MAPRVVVACSTFPFQGLPLDQAFARMAELGFRLAEVSIHHDPVWGHIQPAGLVEDPLLVLELLERAERESGVRIAALNLNTDRTALSERGQFEAAVKLARRARVPVVSVLAGVRDETVEIRRLADFAAICADHGATLCVETFPGSLAATVEGALRVADRLPSAGLTLDTGNLLSHGEPQEKWEALYSRVRHVHLRDGGEGADRSQLPVGRGVLDVAGLVGGLESAGYRGAFTVEYLDPLPEHPFQLRAETEVRRMLEALELAAPAPGNPGGG